METPVERLIKAVEKGYTENKELWKEWKQTMLEAEKQMIQEAFFCGDNSEFHIGVSGINSVKDYMEYYKNCK